MNSFSMEHLLIVLVFFSLIIIVLATIKLQKTILLKHQQSGLIKKGYFGYSWTYLLFGWIVPVIRGEIQIGVLHLVLTIFTFGIFQMIMPFLYNKQYTTRLLISGWQLNDEESVIVAAKLKLAIV
jgi:hypothetical protein